MYSRKNGNYDIYDKNMIIFPKIFFLFFVNFVEAIQSSGK